MMMILYGKLRIFFKIILIMNVKEKCMKKVFLVKINVYYFFKEG